MNSLIKKSIGKIFYKFYRNFRYIQKSLENLRQNLRSFMRILEGCELILRKIFNKNYRVILQNNFGKILEKILRKLYDFFEKI